MKNRIHKSFLGMVLGVAALLASAGAFADEWPLVPGHFWDVTGVEIKDGGGLQYATFLATEWRANQEFAKAQGWIKDYMILANSYPRQGEPDLYLISITEQVASGAESEKRQAAYMAWRKKTLAQMQTESGNRAAFRNVLSDALLQEMKFRN